jgi:hypothetical protein
MESGITVHHPDTSSAEGIRLSENIDIFLSVSLKKEYKRDRSFLINAHAETTALRSGYAAICFSPSEGNCRSNGNSMFNISRISGNRLLIHGQPQLLIQLTGAPTKI